MKPPLLQAVAALLVLTSSLSAATEDYDDSEEEIEEGVSPMETSDASPQQEFSQYPSARPILGKEWGVVLSGDFLYWKTQEGGLAYALPSPNFTCFPPLQQSDPSKGVDGKIARLSPGYAPGFRLGLDIELPKDDWELSFSWTSYHNTHHSSVFAHDDQVVFPFWLNFSFAPIAMSAKADFRLHFNTVDLVIGRSAYVGQFLSIRPFAGFQAAWIEQNFNINYKSITFFTGEITPPLLTTPKISIKNQNFSQGYGLKMGMDSKWELAWGFYIEGDAAVSLLRTDFDIKQHEYNADGSTRSKIKDDFKLVTTVLDLYGALAWEWRFHDDRCYIQLHGGWEEQLWFSQNQLNRFLDNEDVGAMENERSDLSFSGWTIGAKLGF